MATNLKNLSVFDTETPSAEEMKFGIVVAEWNSAITGELLNGAIKTLQDAGCKSENILVRNVPGTFELSLGSKFFAQYTDVDAIIVLGCVIQGETRHFDFVCQGVTHGINQVSLTHNIPIAFGVLTTENQQQAIDRAGGKHGNKGDEAAYTAIRMAQMQYEMCLEEIEEEVVEELANSSNTQIN